MCDCSNKDEDTPTAEPSPEMPDTEENGENTHNSEPFTDERKGKWLDKVKEKAELERLKEQQKRDTLFGEIQENISGTKK